MNNKNKNEMGRGWRGRTVGLLVLALFALGFGWIGFSALQSLTATLHTAWTARSWQAVPVEVLESRLRVSSSSESPTYAVQARYRYEWAGRSYESTRVGLTGGNGGDNIDDWHHAWDARLQAAREGGTPVKAWVDPLHPERSVLDRQLRWRQVLFTLPFAVLFPLVAIGACYGAWASLVRKDSTRPPPLEAQRHVPQHNVIGLWLFATIICVMTLPVIMMASAPSTPAWTALIATMFVIAGLALLWAAVKATRRAWIYRGSFASFQPAQPRAGAAFQAHWTLPSRAAPRWPLNSSVRLRVAQYRIDDSGSSSSERLAEHFMQDARPIPSPDGGLNLQARFELPSDAPSQGARRSGEKVEWRLEWLDGKENILLVVPIPVQAAATADDASLDRLSRDALPVKQDIAPAASDDAMPPLPAGVTLHERPEALLLSFSQNGWRRLGGALLIALIVSSLRSMPWLELVLLALALHAFSRRWTLEMRDDGLVLERVSWLWHRRIGLPPACLRSLYQRVLYSHGTAGQHMTARQALWARGVDRGSDLRLTPGLLGTGPELIAQMLRWASVQRGGRFSPGALRDAPTGLSRPGWGWLVCMLWLAVRLSTT